MEQNVKIYWKDLIKMLRKGEKPEFESIDFNNEEIEFKDASLFNRNGILVPEDLIKYNDEEIDFSDNPEITNKEIDFFQQSKDIIQSLPLKPDTSTVSFTDNCSL